MKVLRLADRRDLRLAQVLGAQFGFGAASDVIDQLAEQLGEFRLEREQQIAAFRAVDQHVEQLGELCREREQQIAALKAELDDALADLERTKAELELLRLLNAWPQQCATRQ